MNVNGCLSEHLFYIFCCGFQNLGADTNVKGSRGQTSGQLCGTTEKKKTNASQQLAAVMELLPAQWFKNS